MAPRGKISRPRTTGKRAQTYAAPLVLPNAPPAVIPRVMGQGSAAQGVVPVETPLIASPRHFSHNLHYALVMGGN